MNSYTKYVSRRGELSGAIINVIRQSDTFLLPKEIRERLGVVSGLPGGRPRKTDDTNKTTIRANTGFYASAVTAVSGLRKSKKIIGVQVFVKNPAGFLVKTYLNGLPEYYKDALELKPAYEEKLIARIIELGVYFYLDGEYTRPIDELY